MYNKTKVLSISNGAGMSVKNLQVVSFDSEWKEIYLGTIRRNHFSAFCPHNVPNAVSIDYKWLHQDEGPDAENSSIVSLTVSKWCPLENCTVLVLGSQFGIKLFDWDGSTLIYYYDFVENGIGVDDREVTGGQARGISALGSNYIAVGIHTGTILLFKVISSEKCFTCTGDLGFFIIYSMLTKYLCIFTENTINGKYFSCIQILNNQQFLILSL